MEHPYLDIVILKNPCTGALEQMPVAMITAYVPYCAFLRLEEAAKVAAIRDDEAATNLLFSIILDERNTEYRRVITPPELPEGAGFDLLAVEPPSLR